MTADTLLLRDVPLWLDARAFLDVRGNDVHTLISYRLARALLAEHDGVNAAVVLPAILLHDVGWSRVDPALLADAVGPTVPTPFGLITADVPPYRLRNSTPSRPGTAHRHWVGLSSWQWQGATPPRGPT